MGARPVVGLAAGAPVVRPSSPDRCAPLSQALRAPPRTGEPGARGQAGAGIAQKTARNIRMLLGKVLTQPRLVKIAG